MSLFRKFLEEAEYAAQNPIPGDVVELEFGDELVIEAVVAEINDDGDIMLEGDEQALNLITQALLTEAEYQGRKVPLGKPMAGDVKKSKVYVRGPKGNVVKVNFGDKNMRIKKNIPGRRKNFRARHNCATPGPRWKARYWSCRAW